MVRYLPYICTRTYCTSGTKGRYGTSVCMRAERVVEPERFYCRSHPTYRAYSVCLGCFLFWHKEKWAGLGNNRRPFFESFPHFEMLQIFEFLWNYFTFFDLWNRYIPTGSSDFGIKKNCLALEITGFHFLCHSDFEMLHIFEFMWNCGGTGIYTTLLTNTVQVPVPNTTGTVMDSGSVYIGLLGR